MTTSLKLTTALVASLSLVVPTAVPAQQHEADTQNAALDCPEGLVPAPRATDQAAADATAPDQGADATANADHPAADDRECVTPEEAAARATAASSAAEHTQAGATDPAQADATASGDAASGDAAAGADMTGTAGIDAGSAASGAASGMAEGSGDAGINALGSSTESSATAADSATPAPAHDGAAGATDSGTATADTAPADAATGTDGAAATAGTDATGSATSGTDTTAPAMTGSADTGAATNGTAAADTGAAATAPADGATTGAAGADATAGATPADGTTGADMNATAGTGADATANGDAATTTGTDMNAASGTGAAAAGATPDQTAATLASEEAAAAEANAATEAAAQLKALITGNDNGSADAQAQPQDVQTETVTEENSRSSGEEFDSKIQATAAATESGSTATEDKKKGLTDLEKALLVGAGALAVGQLLGNNRQVVTSSNDRVVVSRGDGSYEIIKDDNALLRQPGSQVQTETFSDGSTRSTVTRDDGSKIVTIRDPQLRVVRRVRVDTNGDQVILIDDTAQVQPVNVTELPRPETRTVDIAQVQNTEDALRQALEQRATYDRNFSLSQIRDIPQVRALAPAVDLDNVTFETGSAAIQPDQADHLATLGRTIKDIIAQNPREVFLVEGHTDAVGDAAYNLALSDRRAESVALALSEYFGVPPENLVVQGYGEQFLKVRTEGAERANRRATVRRITPLLQTAAVQ